MNLTTSHPDELVLMCGNLLLSLGLLPPPAARWCHRLVLDDVGRVNALEPALARAVKSSAAIVPGFRKGRCVHLAECGNRSVVVARDHRRVGFEKRDVADVLHRIPRAKQSQHSFR